MRHSVLLHTVLHLVFGDDINSVELKKKQQYFAASNIQFKHNTYTSVHPKQRHSFIDLVSALHHLVLASVWEVSMLCGCFWFLY